MKAAILSIGTELVLGQTVDTNAAWLAQCLAARGIGTSLHVTVGDDLDDIAGAIAQASHTCDIVLMTGGLGPTPDDLTRDALACVLGVELRLDSASLARIEEFFAARKRTMAPSNQRQAMIPVGTAAIENTCGTAPGIRVRINKSDVFAMPGVPREMKVMFERDVLPAIRSYGSGAVILQHALHTYGMSESELGERIADLMAGGRNPTIGTSASEMIISVRINARAGSREEAGRLIAGDVAEVRRRLGEVVFGEGEDTLQSVVGRMLIDRRHTIATAESCTGGLIAKRLTDVPGSSAYMVQGFVTYANEAKTQTLAVAADLIERHGAVSAEVAEAMAGQCRRISGTDYAISATGIAGPSGGTPDKPIGLVFVGLASATGTIVRELRLGDHLTRAEVRDRTAKAVLNMLRLELLGLLR